MQILLKQPNIEEALRDYVVKQGFSLRGKEVTIAFTSGRKNNGLTADIQIEDKGVDYPDLPNDDEVTATQKPNHLTAVPTTSTETEEVKEDEKVEAETQEELDAQQSKPTSLFGS